MDYQVRNAQNKDLPEIFSIYTRARAFMAANGNGSQWGTKNPPPEKIRGDLERGELYVIQNETGIHGVFMFSMEEDPTYQVIENGAWHGETPYGVIHRVAGDGSGGILQAAVAFAEEKVSYLRMDTHENNHPMQGALLKQGFTYCGIIYLQNGSPRWAYDRLK